jgi:hypothetical protein
VCFKKKEEPKESRKTREYILSYLGQSVSASSRISYSRDKEVFTIRKITYDEVRGVGGSWCGDRGPWLMSMSALELNKTLSG